MSQGVADRDWKELSSLFAWAEFYKENKQEASFRKCQAQIKAKNEEIEGRRKKLFRIKRD